MNNLYDFLGLPRTASWSEMDVACHQLADRYHPVDNPQAILAISQLFRDATLLPLIPVQLPKNQEDDSTTSSHPEISMCGSENVQPYDPLQRYCLTIIGYVVARDVPLPIETVTILANALNDSQVLTQEAVAILLNQLVEQPTFVHDYVPILIPSFERALTTNNAPVQRPVLKALVTLVKHNLSLSNVVFKQLLGIVQQRSNDSSIIRVKKYAFKLISYAAEYGQLLPLELVAELEKVLSNLEDINCIVIFTLIKVITNGQALSEHSAQVFSQLLTRPDTRVYSSIALNLLAERQVVLSPEILLHLCQIFVDEHSPKPARQSCINALHLVVTHQKTVPDFVLRQLEPALTNDDTDSCKDALYVLIEAVKQDNVLSGDLLQSVEVALNKHPSAWNYICSFLRIYLQKLDYQPPLSDRSYEIIGRAIVDEQNDVGIRQDCREILMQSAQKGRILPRSGVLYLEHLLDDNIITIDSENVLSAVYHAMQTGKHGLMEKSLTILSTFFENRENKLGYRKVAIDIIGISARNQLHGYSKALLNSLANVLSEFQPVLSNACFIALFYHVNNLIDNKTLPTRLIEHVYRAFIHADMAVDAMKVFKLVLAHANAQEKARLLDKFLNIATQVLFVNQDNDVYQDALSLLEMARSGRPEVVERILDRLDHTPLVHDDLDENNQFSLDVLATIATEEKTITTLLSEIDAQHPDHDLSFLRNQFDAVMMALQQDAQLCSLEKPIYTWDKEDCLKWAITVKTQRTNACDPSFLAEMIAVVSCGHELTKSHKPRVIQILSILLFLNATEQGRLAQIATGEGKSLIVAMLAVIKVLQGEKVDIVTSSPLLARRDAEDQKEFYSVFDISVDDNWNNRDSEQYEGGVKPCYLADIVYGDVTSFQWDLLRHEYKREETRGSRPYDSVIVDEVDSMLIDGFNNTAILGGHKPAMEYLGPLFIAVWTKQMRINPQASLAQEEVVLQLKEYLIELVTSLDSPISIPTHLKAYALSQAESWARSAVTARECYTEGRDYVLTEGEDKHPIISPVDYRHTGVTHPNTAWGNGLHQFLQIKHHANMTAEHLHTSYISNLGYFKRYGKRIYGMTGTLGAPDERDLLASLYKLDLIFIPTFKPKRFVEFPAVLAETDEQWYVEVACAVTRETARGRPILIICECINQVLTLRQILVQAGIHDISLYSRSDNDEYLSISTRVKTKQVIIATNLAGRGTNIKTTNEVEINGGLHVCVTFLPSNLRIEEQNFGRTSRQGHLGSAQLILNKMATRQLLQAQCPHMSGQDSTIEALKDWRNKVEQATLRAVKCYEIEKIELRDALFAAFCELNTTLRAIDENEQKLDEVEERWGFWLKHLEQRLSGKNRFDKDNIMADFQRFKEQMQQEFTENHLKNPCHWVKYGNHLTKEITLENNKRIKLENERVALENERIRQANAAIAAANERTRQEYEDARRALVARPVIKEVITLHISGSKQSMVFFVDDKNQVASSKTIANPNALAASGAEANAQLAAPTYVTPQANVVFSVQKVNYSAAKEAYSKAIELDPLLAVQAYYNRAYATILEHASNYKQAALADLNAAKSRIEEILIPQLITTQVVFSQNMTPALIARNALLQQIQIKINLLALQLKYIEHGIEVLQQATGDVIVHQSKTLPRFFEEMTPNHEISELNETGLYYLFELEELPEDDDEDNLFDSLLCGFLGVMQIALSVTLTMAGQVFLGELLLKQGAADIIGAFKTWVVGGFNGKAYLSDKIFTAAVDVITFGVTKMNNGIAGVNKTIVGKASQGVLKQEAAHTLNRELFLAMTQKKVLEALVTSGIKQAINFGINHLSKRALAQFKSDIAATVREEIIEGLNQPGVKATINLILSVDEKNNNQQYARKIEQLAAHLINPKRDRFASIAGAILKGVLANQHRAIAEIIKLIDFHDSVSKITFLCEQFCEELGVRIKLIEDALPIPIGLVDERALLPRRERLYNAVIDMITRNIMVHLHEGVVRPVTESALGQHIDALAHKIHDSMQVAKLTAQEIESLYKESPPPPSQSAAQEDKKTPRPSRQFLNGVETARGRKPDFVNDTSDQRMLDEFILNQRDPSSELLLFAFSKRKTTDHEMQCRKRCTNIPLRMPVVKSPRSKVSCDRNSQKTHFFAITDDINRRYQPTPVVQFAMKMQQYFDYCHAIGTGAPEGVMDVAHLIQHPYDGLLKPTALFIWDVGVLLSAEISPALKLSQITPISQDMSARQLESQYGSLLYIQALERMKDRYHHLENGIDVVKNAQGPERARMASRLMVSLGLAHKLVHMAEHKVSHYKSRLLAHQASYFATAEMVADVELISSGLTADLSALAAAGHEVGRVTNQLSFFKSPQGFFSAVETTAEVLEFMKPPLEIADKIHSIHEVTETGQNEHQQESVIIKNTH